MKPSRTRFATACLALAVWLPSHANAGVFDDDGARRAIVAMQGKVEAISRDLGAMSARIDTKSDQSVALDMLNQHEQTMREIASLRGQIEELKNLVETGRKNQNTLYADLDARMRKLEPQQQTIDGKAVDVTPSEQRSHDAAWNLFKSGDYEGAANAFADFIKRNPSSAYVPDAQHGLGNAYYALSDYKRAIAAQEVVASTYGDSASAPDALLNIASSYTALKDRKAARNTLERLIRTFPDSPATQEAKDRLAGLK
ncbi:tol-pal system protein YbgF [Massilia luteola]|uniref:tol-pal system protein YbgF n=1 Tax=Massilia luteola TaxID=3081751 RepID=UPI002ACC1907|nr:tol-pal system protein YbgF [Massilia sp. Gc5]